MELSLVAYGEPDAAAPDRRNPTADTVRLFDELARPLRAYLIGSGAAPQDADDAVQETFLRFCRHLHAGGDVSNTHGWIFQVARNFLRDEQRAARRKHAVDLQFVIDRGAPADPQSTPEQRTLSAERERRLRDAIGRLPEQQRECMLLRWAGLRYREIAQVLALNPSSVGVLVHRATTRLSEELS